MMGISISKGDIREILLDAKKPMLSEAGRRRTLLLAGVKEKRKKSEKEGEALGKNVRGVRGKVGQNYKKKSLAPSKRAREGKAWSAGCLREKKSTRRKCRRGDCLEPHLN